MCGVRPRRYGSGEVSCNARQDQTASDKVVSGTSSEDLDLSARSCLDSEALRVHFNTLSMALFENESDV